MTDRNDTISQHLKAFASLNDNDINDSYAFWKSRKMDKGDFFNMQQMVCNDLGLIVKRHIPHLLSRAGYKRR